MLRLHPAARLLGALLTIAAALLAHSLLGLMPALAVVTMVVAVSGIGASHLRFVCYVTVPILLALVLVWGIFMDASKVPIPHRSGLQYALFCWLRIIICGGTLQFLFIPLLEHPINLKDFLDRTGLRGALGTLIVSSIIFIPETRRRLAQVIDARRAQSRNLSGVRGLRELPTLLMPLVTSLLDSSVKRAEVWAHRGVLDKRHRLGLDVAYYSHGQSAVAAALAAAVCIAGILV
jgi:energy-coupling factor transporter transmembrane protein EcfT